MEIIIISALWCPSCLLLNKNKRKLIKDYPDIKIKTLDLDLDDELAESFSPGEILPVMIFSDKGKEICRLIGEHSYEEIKHKILEAFDI